MNKLKLIIEILRAKDERELSTYKNGEESINTSEFIDGYSQGELTATLKYCAIISDIKEQITNE